MSELIAIVVDALTALIASVALFMAYQSNKAMKEHNKLSVKPRLTTTTHADPTHYLDGSVSVLHFRMRLTNAGLGPAVIKTFEVMLDG